MGISEEAKVICMLFDINIYIPCDVRMVGKGKGSIADKEKYHARMEAYNESRAQMKI